MTSYAVFLRGINVGGINIKMAALREALQAAGFQDAGTLLASGNVAWLAPTGGTLDSPFSKISAKARFKEATTTRNLRTLVKVRDAASRLQPS